MTLWWVHLQSNFLPLDEKTVATVPNSKPYRNVLAIRNTTKSQVREALEALPLELRTVIILREFGGFSYKEISRIVGAPISTVMSRLACARLRLASLLQKEAENK